MWFRRTVQAVRRYYRLNKQDRHMFYTLLATQMESGFVASRACKTLEDLDGLSAGVREVAMAGSQAGREGKSAVTGMYETGLIPDDEYAALRIAELNDMLPRALMAQIERDNAGNSFFAKVIKPNLYYLTILGVVLVFMTRTPGFFEKMRIKATGNALYEFALILQDWLIPVLALLMALVAVISWGMRRWTGSGRRFLGPFDEISRLQYGIRFCDLAEMMSSNGAQGKLILQQVKDLFSRSRFITWHAEMAETSMQRDGTRLEDALSDGLLMQRHAALLKGLVPGGDVSRYESGYRTLGILQRQLLDNRFRNMTRMFRLLLLGSTVYLLMLMLGGMYEIFDSFKEIQRR